MALAPGSLTDVTGIEVGHAAVNGRPSGCTVVLCPDTPHGTVCGVAVRGGAPGTRETDLLRPENTVNRVHAVLLTGGSAFGLDAAGGVMRWLEEQGRGLVIGPLRGQDSAQASKHSQSGSPMQGPIRVPIVPAAVLFDLWIGDPRVRPGADTGYAACLAARSSAPAQGSHGAGLGATVGKLFGVARASRGGIGTASLRVGAVTVAALVAVNAIGDVLDEHGEVLAGARSEDGQRLVGAHRALLRGDAPLPVMERMAGTATTIGIVATDAMLDKSAATQLAALAHHGLSRAVSPITVNDGDTLFALATGGAGIVGDLSTLGALAAEVVARAIRNGVRAAATLESPMRLPAARDMKTR
ncbi:MAG: P1 family peptidase [Rubrivivax sp.]|nr:P1 family peptidase [Rubrivivax sp.]